MKGCECEPGRAFLTKLPHGKDLLGSIESICVENRIEKAWFNLIGAVSSITFGYYDQNAKEYLSLHKTGDYEIVSCQGNVSLKDGKPFVHAHVIFADEKGNASGGHLFAGTSIFAGEIHIQELKGSPLKRAPDEETGLMLWSDIQ